MRGVLTHDPQPGAVRMVRVAVARAASCPGGIARQFRVQVASGETPSNWKLVGSFRDGRKAGECAARHEQAGQTTRVAFTVTRRELQFWSSSGWVVEPGEFKVWIGPSSDAGLEGKFVVQQRKRSGR